MSRTNGKRLHSGSGLLHPTKGTNPRDLVCPRCNKTHGTIMLGMREHAAICSECKTFNIGLDAYTRKCKKCGAVSLDPKVIPDNMPVPKVCDSCTEEVKHITKVVEAGGVMWKCETCHSSGVFEATHPIAVGARADAGGMACIAQLDADTCPACP